MNELSTQTRQLPDTLEDLSKFVLVGREKLNAVRAEIRAIKAVELAAEVHEQKLEEAQEIAEAVLDAETKLGELTSKMEKAANQYSAKDSGVRSKSEQLEEIGISEKQKQRFETLANHPEAVEQAKADARAEGKIVTRQDVFHRIAAECPNRKQQEARELREAKQRFDNYQEPTGKITSFETAKQHKEDGSMVFNDLYNIVDDAYLSILRVSGKFDQEISQKALASASVIEVRSMTTKLEYCHRFVIKAMKILSEVTNEKQL